VVDLAECVVFWKIGHEKVVVMKAWRTHERQRVGRSVAKGTDIIRYAVYNKLNEGKFIPRVLYVNILRSRGTRDQHRALARDTDSAI
jgi:hypothetical protein